MGLGACRVGGFVRACKQHCVGWSRACRWLLTCTANLSGPQVAIYINGGMHHAMPGGVSASGEYTPPARGFCFVNGSAVFIPFFFMPLLNPQPQDLKPPNPKP